MLHKGRLQQVLVDTSMFLKYGLFAFHEIQPITSKAIKNGALFSIYGWAST